VLDGIDEMKSPEANSAMETILSLCLTTGNYMNAGTSRGQAYGVTLDILLKLGNIKQSDRDKNRPLTLLHYIASIMQKDYSTGSYIYR
jgi:hypothetical protein